MKAKILIASAVLSFAIHHSSFAFEGRITAALTWGDDTQQLLYTVGTNFLRIERIETNWPHAKNILNLQSSEMTLLFPHNRSFVRLKSSSGTGIQSARFNDNQIPDDQKRTDEMPVPLPPDIGPQPFRAPAGSASVTLLPPARPVPPTGAPPGLSPLSTAPGVPAMPIMPTLPMDKADLKPTGETTNFLGFTCARYELKQRGETMEIWATEKLFPFQPYLQNQPHRFGPRMIEEQWGELLQAKKLFPLLAVLKAENGPERLRFEVKAITPEKIKKEDDAKLFQPPTDYREIQPLPF